LTTNRLPSAVILNPYSAVIESGFFDRLSTELIINSDSGVMTFSRSPNFFFVSIGAPACCNVPVLSLTELSIRTEPCSVSS
jgi:hypothetical protein